MSIYRDLGCTSANLMPGDVGFYEGNGVISQLIEEWEPGAPVADDPGFTPSHVFIVFSESAPCHVIEADAQGMAQIVDGAPYLRAAALGLVRFFRPDAPLAQKEAALAWFVTKYAGRPYGWANLLAFWIQSVFGLAHAPWRLGDVCSQTAWIILDHLGVKFVDTILERDCTPAKLFAWAVKG